MHPLRRFEIVHKDTEVRSYAVETDAPSDLKCPRREEDNVLEAALDGAGANLSISVECDRSPIARGRFLSCQIWVLGSNGAEKWHRKMLREQQSELQLLTSFHNIHRLTSVEGQ